MLDTLFRGVFDTATTEVIQVGDFLFCVVTALLMGVILAVMYTYKTKYTQSFVMTVALVPAVVCVIIMMVNGNIGAGVAVAGAFSLVRFRSVPGTAKEICTIFLAMGAGLVTGMGYLAYGLLFTLLVGGIMLLYTALGCWQQNKKGSCKILRVTIPEDLDYTNVFDSIMKKYTNSYELESVKTTNMGSLFKLTYRVALKNAAEEKEFIDKLRCRNGNLEISISMQETMAAEL